uniref:Cytochrome c oxidase subunit 2 n=1 Tax=Megaspilidae sp. ZJUH_2016022 TaxID=2491163 RepID=A0A3Q8UA54_9HYME|nr:cytochrome c oxidase subunit 2 [Megaspilidae sp. ZJUH_2016022]
MLNMIATWWENLSTQNANSPMMENLIYFHDLVMIILITILISMLYLMTKFIFNQLNSSYFMHNQSLEFIWTIIPIFILFFIAFPSIKNLYLMDEINSPAMTIKAIGHQWYWSYEYPELNLSYDSMMLTNQTSMSWIRNLENNNNVLIPTLNKIRLISTSEDVIHSWTIPSCGLKMDSIPGRLNQMELIIKRPGIYFGQCSEICGANHSFMPISLESIKNSNFLMNNLESKIN